MSTTEQKTEYAYSHDGEVYDSMTFPTIEAATARMIEDAATHDTPRGHGFVGEVDWCGSPACFANAELVLEHIDEQDDYRYADGAWSDDVTDAEKEDLSQMLEEAFEAWRVKHNINPRIFSISNEKRVDYTAEQLAAARKPITHAN